MVMELYAWMIQAYKNNLISVCCSIGKKDPYFFNFHKNRFSVSALAKVRFLWFPHENPGSPSLRFSSLFFRPSSLIVVLLQKKNMKLP